MERVATDNIELTGAEILIKSLHKEGVEFVFGYPGGAVLFIYDELPSEKDLPHAALQIRWVTSPPSSDVPVSDSRYGPR